MDGLESASREELLLEVRRLEEAAAALKRFEHRFQFLAEYGEMLARSVDERGIAADVATRVVPVLADLAFVDRADARGRCEGTGAPMPAEELTPTKMVVLLDGDGRAAGALTLVMSHSGRTFDAADHLFAQDIGRRASMAMARARLFYRTKREVQARQDLLAIVSHDLRNPLNVILMSTDMAILSSPPSDRRIKNRKALEAIRRAATRMTRLVDDLLDISSIEGGQFAIQIATHPVAALLSEAVDVMQASAAARNVLLAVREDATSAVPCDRGRTLQVLLNLIGNAIKFTPAGGRVTVHAERRASATWFFVDDTGVGIPPDSRPHIFERFWQEKPASRVGAGLGLTIAKGIVEAHGGRIGVDSAPSGGSSFHFWLPAAGASHVPEAAV